MDDLRYERKFCIENVSVAVVRQAVRLLPWSLRPLYPDRQINNLYFDTPSFDAFHDNASGAGWRQKFRIRWYGNETWPNAEAQMEIKHRTMERGYKTIHPIDPVPPGNFRALTEQLRAFPEAPSSLQPVLMNSYTRAYFGDARGAFHLTIDWNQRFQNVFLRRTGWIEDTSVILELKYREAEAEALTEGILQNLPFRIGKNSKYVQGIQSLFLL